MTVVVPLLIGALYVCVNSLVPEPNRRGFNAVMLAGAGAAYHTAWDVVHHLKGNPIIPFAHESSLGCAICDPVIALWYLAGASSGRSSRTGIA